MNGYHYPPSGDVSAQHILKMSGSAGGRQLAHLHIIAAQSEASADLDWLGSEVRLSDGSFVPFAEGMWN